MCSFCLGLPIFYLQDILYFWLDHGVDGFNIRNAAYMFVDYDLRDEQPLSGSSGVCTQEPTPTHFIMFVFVYLKQ